MEEDLRVYLDHLIIRQSLRYCSIRSPNRNVYDKEVVQTISKPECV
jgi:hypothetical protein